MKFVKYLTLKRLGQIDPSPPLWFFQTCVFQRKGEALVFRDFNIIISHIFLENVIEIPLHVQKT